mmetsp:Transcript_28932/g.27866  ORF Transcript_28932/g.27866 Transcript_28932/m.27866 type:complete len:117 (-) Transcript_28932:319-669(-)|eukprot:CAMPEP_0170567586 /NCGR_PEP_ID=MMETSP0211-20121228/80571_1 /TAXON_ID=311385 /ORGANISM="Pseudokeronopsis sp., Strain OXSARD2" /LENGTH=116 /DNA_ID=CAMNT_0010889077 /DNA_START=386 /DNA_END=736 /DNA_ORIENTATION=-
MLDNVKRVTSRNHKIQIQVSNDSKEVAVSLDGSEDLKEAPTKDFVLLIRDENINVPTAISAYNKDTKEQAIMVNFLPDLKAPLLQAKFLSCVPLNMIDSNPYFSYKDVRDVRENEE